MKCVAIMGATASGKTSAAIALCRKFGGEVVSMDSRQVYRGLDIGTGKVSRDQTRAVAHHLVDIVSPDETWSAGRHAAAAREAMAGIVRAGRLPFLVGGTGLYFRALLGGLVEVDIPADVLARLRSAMTSRATPDLYQELVQRDARRAAQIAPADRVRVTRALELIEFTGRPVCELYDDARTSSPYSVCRVVLTMPRRALRERIAARTRAMFEAGWVDEVRGLLASGVAADAPGMRSLGYGEIARALSAGRPVEAVVDRVIVLTQQYAKRQETFFRGEPGAVWIDVSREGFEGALEGAVAASIST